MSKNNFGTQFNFESQANYNYRSNSFTIKQKKQRFLWKDLMKIDLNYIMKCKDITPIEPYVENILSSSIEEEDFQMLPEHYIIKLITILQYISEYLFYIQEMLEKENEELKQKLSKSTENMGKDSSNEMIIANLKRENQQKDILLKSYQKMLKSNSKKIGKNRLNYNFSSISESDYELEEDKKQSKQRFYCQYCSGKKFSTEQYLEDHMRRRHLDKLHSLNKSSKHIDNRNEIMERKLGELKTHFENLLHTKQMQSEYNRLNDKISGFENILLSNPMQSQPIQTQQQPVNNTQGESKTFIINPQQSNEPGDINEALMKIENTLRKKDEITKNQIQNMANKISHLKKDIMNDIESLKKESEINRNKNQISIRNANNRYKKNTEYNPIDENKFKVREGKKINFEDSVEINKKVSINYKEEQSHRNEIKESKISEKSLVKQEEKKYFNKTPGENDKNSETKSIHKKEEDASEKQNEKESSKNSMTYSEKPRKKNDVETELDKFFKDFTERDNNLEGNMKNYLVDIM